MSDVFGPSNFHGIFFLLGSALAALIFSLVFLGNLFSRQSSTRTASALVAAVNLLATFLVFNGLGSKPASFLDYVSPVWLALSIATFLYLRKSLTAPGPNESHEPD